MTNQFKFYYQNNTDNNTKENKKRGKERIQLNM